MPVKLSDLLKETAAAEVVVGGSKVEIVYRVMWQESFSDEDWLRIGGDNTPEHPGLNGRDYFKEVLPRLLVSWDLLDQRGKPIPVTAAAIVRERIPLHFMRKCEAIVLEAQSLGKANGRA